MRFILSIMMRNGESPPTMIGNYSKCLFWNPFRQAYPGLQSLKNESKISELLENEGIIRHRGKITSAINNAQVLIEIQKEFGSFDSYIWSFTDGEIIKAEYLTESDLSKDISKDLKRRGMKFVGPTIIYSYLESIGIIDNHQKECFKY